MREPRYLQSQIGEQSVCECLAGILQRMPDHINAAHPCVPNPVNPGEDFADK